MTKLRPRNSKQLDDISVSNETRTKGLMCRHQGLDPILNIFTMQSYVIYHWHIYSFAFVNTTQVSKYKSSQYLNGHIVFNAVLVIEHLGYCTFLLMNSAAITIPLSKSLDLPLFIYLQFLEMEFINKSFVWF